MLVMDPADVPLHAAKLCKYAATVTKRGVWLWLANRFFEVFAVVFCITRLVLYGYVVWSSQIEAPRYSVEGLPYWACLALLYPLLLLQLFWFSLILNLAMKWQQGESVEDPR